MRKRIRPAELLKHYAGISRLLAGQLEFASAIKAVAVEIGQFLPHDHIDVCIVMIDGKYHTAYENGIDTDWGRLSAAPIEQSPIRSLLWGEDRYILTDDASVDSRFHFEGAFDRPIFDQTLRSRLHVPMTVQGEVIGALSCSSHQPGLYTLEDVVNAQAIADLLAPYFFSLRAAQLAQHSAIVQAEARAREEGLRQGALNLTEALERERQRIGMDLHDQTLADLTRLTRQIERLAERPEIEGQSLEPISRSLQRCMQELRRIIEHATPSVLQLFGFASAVETHLERATRDSGSSIVFRLVDETEGAIDALEPIVRIALFRIVQEAINNAVLHSRCTSVSVSLEARPAIIEARVMDDGCGMRGEDLYNSGGLGNIATRAQLIGAKMDVSSGPGGKGTAIVISVPRPAATAPGPASEAVTQEAEP
ncbi:GAF domain-containing sensor histidine kinase [Pelagibacterium limicola]|uniref:GAF domain-containing sensor histidine kinase n=1 Tax=Pelagibacterium limicola TaxID=2791022 RepID=UPI0018AF9AF0|nr:GAF domain-containing sensor histidine kinase [Pelagibacterium limicola]